MRENSESVTAANSAALQTKPILRRGEGIGVSDDSTSSGKGQESCCYVCGQQSWAAFAAFAHLRGQGLSNVYPRSLCSLLMLWGRWAGLAISMRGLSAKVRLSIELANQGGAEW
jgi:hypothetical protein